MIKKIVSIMLSAATIASFIPQVPAKAEEIERYPYTLFAGSNEEGALTINSNNVCINGNIATNGTISTTAQYFNVNGIRKENAQEEVKLFFNKINERYFTSHVDTYFEDYFLEDTNINVNIPIEAAGDIGLTGNINITSGIKALNDVILSGNVENTQDSVICAETGDITINTENVNLNGLVYAPNGCVNITAQNLNINSVIIIADTITITCPNLNANYNAQMAEFIGNETEPVIINDDTELEIVSFGDYDDEDEKFTIYWNTTVPEGNFDILCSDDGENYTSIGTVINDDSYECTFTESFDKKYIKVVETTKSGKVCESLPFVVSCTENGYDIKVLDSDEDGLPDIYELKIGTDINKVDTDEDGLTDYQEYVFTNTDPLVYDSVIEGTSDADIDTDEDGLSNIDEFTRETYPWTPDTDNDGFSDYDEIFVYNTNPLVADSDEDGIDDGSEIKLGLDPNDPATNGVPDGEYVIPQSIEADSDILSFVNTAESPYELSIDIKTNGDAAKELTVDESGYSAVIKNDAMIGSSIDVELTDACNPEEIVLKYNIKKAYTDNTLNKFSSLDEFKGIKRLNVFRFDKKQGMLLPVETQFDVENNQLYAEVNETGTYCLMDMEIWLDTLIEKQINLVFMIQANYNKSTDGSEEDYNQRFEFQKNIIRKMSRVALSKLKGVDLKIYVIAYSNSKIESCVTAPDGNKYFTDYKSISDTLDEIKYTKDSNVADRDIAFECLIKNTPVYSNSNTFVYHLINGKTTIDRHFDESKNNSSYDVYHVQKIINNYNYYSQVYYSKDDFHPGYTIKPGDPDFSADIIKCGGVSVPIDTTTDSNFESIKEHFLYKVQQRLGIVVSDTYDIIIPTKWKKITLKSKLTPNGTTNSDTDSLTDWEEVDTSKLKINTDDSIELPVFCIADIVGHLTRFNNNGEYNFLINNITPRYYLPILSDPTMDNSDGDAMDDSSDDEPLYHDPDPLSDSNILSSEIKYIPLQKVKSFTGKIGRQFAKKWDCDVYISILKSCDCDDDIFVLTNGDQSFSEVFAISDELKKKLNNGEKEYSNSFGHVPNEEAAHTGKLETDQLVPEFFDQDSSYYYGCWYHNYCQEMAMYNDYVQQIGTNWSRVMQAIIIYNIATSALQNAVLSSANNTYTVSKSDYANGAKAAKTQLSYSRVSKQAAEHSSLGEFTYNPKTGAVSRMKGGGHGQANIDFLEKNGFDYNIEKTYSNGVRVGNVPAHKIVAKRTGTNQSWFPETWTEQDIINAGEYVGNLSGNTNVADGVIVYGEYNGVRVGVIRTGGSISTVFPDSVRQP